MACDMAINITLNLIIFLVICSKRNIKVYLVVVAKLKIALTFI